MPAESLCKRIKRTEKQPQGHELFLTSVSLCIKKRHHFCLFSRNPYLFSPRFVYKSPAICARNRGKNTCKSRENLQRIAGKLKTKHGRTRIIIKGMWKGGRRIANPSERVFICLQAGRKGHYLTTIFLPFLMYMPLWVGWPSMGRPNRSKVEC